jgi:hypothetical protein
VKAAAALPVAMAALLVASGAAAQIAMPKLAPRAPGAPPPKPAPPAAPAAPTAPAAPAAHAAHAAHKPAAAVHGHAPRKEAPPAGPAPDVKLSVEAPARSGPWTMRVTNAGDVPVRLVADARLLVLEVTPRSAAKAVRCELPADMRPADDADSALVLPPGRSYAETFDPRLYCFGGRLADALGTGASVVARLGWTGGSKARAPYVVQSIDGVEPVLAPLKALQADAIGVPDDPSVPLTSFGAPRPDDPDPVKLAIRGPASIDAGSPGGISIDVTLRNEGKRPVSLRFRPETLRFQVAGPSSVEDCRWPLQPVAAMRELFTTVRPGGAQDLAVLLHDYCSGHVFDDPGLLVIRPSLDTRKASGADIAIKTFDGEVIATTTTLLRLHQGAKPPQLRRPHLEPIPGAPPPGPPSGAPPGASLGPPPPGASSHPGLAPAPSSLAAPPPSPR